MVKRRIFTIIVLIAMFLIGVVTYPNSEIFSLEFWLWLTLLLGGTIIVANVFLLEQQMELFDHFSKENFKKAPIFGILAIPFIVSLLATVIKWLGTNI